jgi:hypothetical protein
MKRKMATVATLLLALGANMPRALSAPASGSENVSFQDSLAAFEKLHSLADACKGNETRILTGIVSGAGFSVTALYTWIAHGDAKRSGGMMGGVISGQLQNVLQTAMDHNELDYVAPIARYRAGKRAAIKVLMKGGPLGAVFASLMAASLVASDDSAAELVDKLGDVARDVSYGFLGISHTAKDDTLSAYYANNAKAFIDDFLALPPETAKFYLADNQSLRNLTKGYSMLADLSVAKSDVWECRATKSNAGAMGARALMNPAAQ